MKTLYRREGKVTSADGVLDFKVEIPKEMGGKGGAFTNPEQLFAAGYSACFDSALNLVARKMKIKLESTAITAEVVGKYCHYCRSWYWSERFGRF